MKAKNVWLLFICFFNITILLVACNSVSTTTSILGKTTTSSISSPTETATTPRSEQPVYGDTLTLLPLSDISIFDGIAKGQALGLAAQLARDEYLGADWTRGAAGTGEFNWGPNSSPAPDTCTGILAESWTIPELGKVVFKVRRGVHWALNPNSEASRLMNGREVTADDWIATFNYAMSPQSSLRYFIPQLYGTATMEKTGPWEVTLKTPIDPLVGWSWLALGGPFPPEVIAKYGNMQDWHNFAHTGPFMITDYVAGSSATLTRNPNYWERDPIGPGKGNQLPYLDKVKMLVTTDISTMIAALRIAKVDFFAGVPAEESKIFIDSYPELKYSSYVAGNPIGIAMRLDKSDLPYKNKKVRQALMLATDFSSIKNEYYSGMADILSFPVTSESKEAYVPLEEMPESAQALYRYNPDEAKALLAEAGYPDGFTVKMVLWNGADFPDLASVLKEMWAKTGINLVLEPKELGAFTTIAYSGSYEELILSNFLTGSLYPNCLSLGYFRNGSFGHVSDPVIDSASKEIQQHVIIDMPEANRRFRELIPYIVEQAYYLPLPNVYAYSLWWPWLKNYHGETPIQFAKYWWIDSPMKKEITGRR